MTIIPITGDAPKTKLVELDAYPAVIAFPMYFTGKDADGSTRRTTKIEVGCRPRIVSACASTKSNRCSVTIESDGILQIFRARIKAGSVTPRNEKILRVRVMSIPYGRGVSERAGLAVDADGHNHKLTRDKYMSYIHTALCSWVEDVIMNRELPLTIDEDKLPKDIAGTLNYNILMRCSVRSTREKHHQVALRTMACLSNDTKRFNLKDAIELGILPDYPVIDVPYRAFHAYDMRIETKFIGLIQFGGAPNNTMNVRTANRLARVIGEPVKHTDLIHQLVSGDFLYSLIGASTRVYCLCVVNKTTKGA